ncbi:hypothetical protein EZJ19_03220 [Parasulfuritortus cantonensis]|uniref:O-antigen polymerase n=2 Tax=Parasulfuritortus cantonensis TaxID=2528202 RepID=A0A4R1BKR8_9PROT|nr:hypothetical protein EZJ19_03220 [Parasulfuritortus cantonensis]
MSWLIAGAASLLLLYVVAEGFKKAAVYQRTSTPGIILLACVFILLAVFTTLFNHGALGTTISGIKGYFQIWPLLFVMALVRWDEATMRAFPKAMFWIALIQIPFVLQQYLVLVPERTGMGFGIVPVDIVSGTFGGDRRGGGANATLALFMVTVWAGILARWKLNLMSNWGMFLASLLLLFPLFVNETKVAVIYLAMVFLALYWEDLAKRPHVFLIGVVSTALMIFALLTSYVAIHANERGITMETYIQGSIDENFGDLRNRWSTYLNRYSVYGFWAQHHGLQDPSHTLIGHGLAQSKEATGGAIPIKSLATDHYAHMGIGLTAVPAMLWDVGLIGTCIILAMFWWGWRTASLVARHYYSDGNMYALFRAIQAMIPVFALSLAHKNFFVFDLPYQTLVIGTLGYIAYWQRRMNEDLNLREITAKPSNDGQP